MRQRDVSLRDRAIRLLAQREHSRAEIRRKLATHGSPEEIDAAIDSLAELDLQSDTRFAHAWIRARAGRFGVARIRHDLAQRGVDRDTIETAISEEIDEPEIERARLVWQTRFGVQPEDRKTWGKQARFLQSRGFSTGTITRLLNECDDESP